MGSLRLIGAAALTVAAIGALPSGAPAQSASASGSLVFARDSSPSGRRSTLQVLDLQSKAVSELFKPTQAVYDVAVSPDGSLVAYVAGGRPGDQLRVVGTDGTGDRRLVAGSDIIDTVSWTPDGERLVYSAGPFDGRGNRQLKRSEIYSVAVEGGEPTRLTRDDLADFDPSVTPDGERIVFAHNAEAPNGGDPTRLDIFSMALDGSDLVQITDTKADELGIEVSPDGRRIVFLKDLPLKPGDERRLSVVQVSSIDGSNRVTVMRGAGDDSGPTWSPDGKRIAFASDRADSKPDDDYFRRQLFTAKPDGTRVKPLLASRFGDALPSYVP